MIGRNKKRVRVYSSILFVILVLTLTNSNIPVNATPNLIFTAIEEFNDDSSGQSQGDNDGIVEAGETIELRIALSNSGDQEATNVNATISSLDSNVNITTATQSFVSISAGGTGLSSSYYVFSVNSSCSEGHIMDFSLDIESSEGIWTESFSITVENAPNVEFHGYRISNEGNGGVEPDNDDNLDPGEQIGFYIYVINTGRANLYEVTGILSTTGTASSTYVTLNDNTGDFGTILGGGDTEYSFFDLTLNGACPDKTELGFILTLTDKFSTDWVVEFTIVVNGEPSLELISIEFFEYDGDGDTNMDVGEEWYSELTLRNNGTGYSGSIYVLFTSDDNYIEFYYDTVSGRNVSFGELWVGEIDDYYSSYYWSFIISDNIPVNYTIDFDFIVTGEIVQQQTFESSQTIKGTTDYQIVNTTFIEYDGNEDENIDAGETWYFEITVENVGEANGKYLDVFINSTDKYVIFEYGESYRYTNFGDIEVGQNATEVDSYWRFTVSSSAPRNHNCSFVAILTDETEQMWEFNLTATVTEIPEFELVSVTFTNYYDSTDEYMDAGEMWYVELSIQNVGIGWGKELYMSVYSNSKYVEFYYDGDSSDYRNISIEEDLKSGETGTFGDYYYWRFTIPEKAPRQYEISFNFILADENGNIVSEYEESSIIRKGRIRIFGLPTSGTALFFIIAGIVALVAYPIYRYRVYGLKPLRQWSERIKRNRRAKRKNRKAKQQERQYQRELRQQKRELLKQEKEREMLRSIKENEMVLLEKFKDILEMTQAVPIKDVARSLGLKKEHLFEKLLDWNDNLQFKIKGDMIIVDDMGIFREEMDGFLSQLDSQFKDWEESVKEKKTKKDN